MSAKNSSRKRTKLSRNNSSCTHQSNFEIVYIVYNWVWIYIDSGTSERLKANYSTLPTHFTNDKLAATKHTSELQSQIVFNTDLSSLKVVSYTKSRNASNPHKSNNSLSK